MRATLESQNGDYDLTSKVQVFNYTMPASAGPSLCYARLVFGDGAKDLDGTGGTFELYVEVDGVPREPYPQEVEFSTETQTGIDVEPFVADDSEDIDIYVTSPNAGDSDVDVTVKLYDISPFQSLTRGRDGLVDADGKVTVPDTQKVDVETIKTKSVTVDAGGTTFPASVGTSTLAAGAKMDLADSLNSTGVTDLKTKLGTIPASVSGGALEATLEAMKGATFNTATDSLEAIRNRGDAAWAAAGGLTADDVKELLGGLGRYKRMKNVTYDDDGEVTSAEIHIYDDSTNYDANGDGDVVYDYTATVTNGQVTAYGFKKR